MQLLLLLHKYQHIFDGLIGTLNAKPCDIELKHNAKPYHSRPFPVTKIHEATLKIELECLTKAGVLKSQPKQMDSTHFSNTKERCYGLIHFQFP
jgi:hypothetical protein